MFERGGFTVVYRERREKNIIVQEVNKFENTLSRVLF